MDEVDYDYPVFLQEYMYLNEGDVYEAGDEYLSNKNEWCPIPKCLVGGLKWDNELKVRRVDDEWAEREADKEAKDKEESIPSARERTPSLGIRRN